MQGLSKPITEAGALGGTRTPTMLLTATSRQRVYQFRHERLGDRGLAPGRINGADVTNQDWGDKSREACDLTEIWAGPAASGCPADAAAFA
jgi:hypothetical protein